MDPLTEKLKDLDLCSACLRFNPTGDAAEKIRAKLSQTPRYLFRVYDKKTASATDARWVRSLDAINAERNHASDIFMRSDTRAVAQELNEHLRWWHTTSGKNNIVSWTSSLPFALAYGVYRNTWERLKSPVQEIHLCVVDTSKLPHGAFINDLDLMQEYSGEFEPDEHIPIWIRNQPSTGPWRQFGLPNLIHFRKKPDKDGRQHGQFSAYNYFGEYLSQGALKIESACTILSFNKILGPNLYTIYPGFRYGDQAKWATAVLELREAFYDGGTPELCSPAEIQASLSVAANFESQWRLVIAASLISIRPRRDDEQTIITALRELIMGRCHEIDSHAHLLTLVSRHRYPGLFPTGRFREYGFRPT